MTGRWMAHSAERKNGGKTAGNESSHSTDEAEGEGREGGVKSIHSAGTTATDVAVTSVMSCSPIFIMQDLYCIGQSGLPLLACSTAVVQSSVTHTH